MTLHYITLHYMTPQIPETYSEEDCEPYLASDRYAGMRLAWTGFFIKALTPVYNSLHSRTSHYNYIALLLHQGTHQLVTLQNVTLHYITSHCIASSSRRSLVDHASSQLVTTLPYTPVHKVPYTPVDSRGCGARWGDAGGQTPDRRWCGAHRRRRSDLVASNHSRVTVATRGPALFHNLPSFLDHLPSLITFLPSLITFLP